VSSYCLFSLLALFNAYEWVVRLCAAEQMGDETGFDVWTLISVASKLKLPFQHMSLSIVEVDVKDELSLNLALKSCKRMSVSVEEASSIQHNIFEDLFSKHNAAHPLYGDSQLTSTAHNVLDPDCIWKYLQHFDEDEEDGKSANLHTRAKQQSQEDSFTQTVKREDGSTVTVSLSRADVITMNKLNRLSTQLEK
jgi:hypothetical protein